MSPVTSETRVEWSSRLAEALVQGGYDTETNLAPLVAEAQATGEPLATLLISRNLALPGVVVGALAHLAKMQAIDLAAMTPSPDAMAAHAGRRGSRVRSRGAAVRRDGTGRGVLRAAIQRGRGRVGLPSGTSHQSGTRGSQS